MPAKDRYHDNVARILTEKGWRVSDEQGLLNIDRRHVWIDIQAERQGETVYIEVKGFETNYSIVEYLAAAVGQVIMYQAVIDYLGLGISLYLGVPEQAYHGILAETLGQQVIENADIQLLVFNPEAEEITEWQV